METIKFALTGGPYGKFKKPSKDNMVLFCLAFFTAALGYLAEPCSLFMKICNQDSSPTTLYMMAQMCRCVCDSRSLFIIEKKKVLHSMSFVRDQEESK